MNTLEAIQSRHSVRRFQPTPLSSRDIGLLEREIRWCCEKSGLVIRLVLNEPQAFGAYARYGWFSHVANYILMAGKADQQQEEAVGYWGEHLVLFAQKLGLNTCWAAGTFKKDPKILHLESHEKVYALIAIGYGQNPGKPHKNKPAEKISNLSPSSPDWFAQGVKAALLAPTAINQQKFYLEQKGDQVKATARKGPYSKLDLGIVKYHFEVGSGKDSSVWID